MRDESRAYAFRARQALITYRDAGVLFSALFFSLFTAAEPLHRKREQLDVHDCAF
jgi:hypothetical protein